MKTKSNKLAKLERKRTSILTEQEDVCFLCGRLRDDIHEIFGGANRTASMKHGFCVPLCRSCHERVTNNEEASKVLKRLCQAKFEKTHTRQEFYDIVGRNYLPN